MNYIVSIGPPPERYADRMVGKMLRELAAKRTKVFQVYADILKTSSNGSPRAQAKLADRLHRAGAVRVALRPGKRGRFELQFCDIAGWNPGTDEEIAEGDPIPECPWLAGSLTNLKSLGRGRVEPLSIVMVLVTHHALSRAAQRHGASKPEHLILVANSILLGVADFVLAKGWGPALQAPPQGWRVPIGRSGGVTLVLQRHERLSTLVATTLF